LSQRSTALGAHSRVVGGRESALPERYVLQ